MAGSIVRVGKHEYVLASRKRRALAALVDFVIVSGILILLDDYAGVLIFPAIAYFSMGDGIFRGRRLGKRLFGLKVIDARHGTPCTPFQDFIRNCGRASVFWGGGLGAILRAYDHAAGNVPSQPEIYVILTRPVTDADRPPAPPPEKPAKLDLEGMKRSLTRSTDSPPE